PGTALVLLRGWREAHGSSPRRRGLRLGGHHLEAYYRVIEHMGNGGIRYGISFLHREWAATHPAGRRRLLDSCASAGAGHVVVADHVSFRGGDGFDGLVSAGSVLAAHDTLGAYVSVYLLALRHPVPVARQLATLAELHPGRLVLGVGVGGDDRAEVIACGVDPRTRGRRTDEALAVLR